MKSGVAVATAVAITPKTSESAARVGFPILQTYTNDDSAQFRIVADTASPVAYIARDKAGAAKRVTVLSRESNPFTTKRAIDHIVVDGLKPAETYILEVRDVRTNALIDSREFSALDTKSKRLNFVVGSCTHDLFSGQKEIWQSVYDMKPDIIFLIGDSCYADWSSDGSLPGHWERNFETRDTVDVYWWKRLTPLIATWDDHDYGKGNGDRTNPMREDVYTTFKAFFGSEQRRGLKNGPGVSSMLMIRGHRFCLMDDRYFRDPLEVTNGLHWGEDQEKWLFDEIGASTEPVWLMNGSQFFGGYRKKESMESNHPFQFKRVLDRLAKAKAPVMFCSGDVHFTELMTIEPPILGYQSLEITSSAMHSTTFPGTPNRGDANPRRFGKGIWQNNFVFVESDASTPGTVNIRTRCVGKSKKIYFDHSFVIKNKSA
ncbi:MAG TPA: hypothetical protein VM432_02375 [Bdellovibrionales bacterium]|nr:hypothetical protein [Bdellovibrionales bacterium]